MLAMEMLFLLFLLLLLLLNANTWISKKKQAYRYLYEVDERERERKRADKKKYPRNNWKLWWWRDIYVWSNERFHVQFLGSWTRTEKPQKNIWKKKMGNNNNNYTTSPKKYKKMKTKFCGHNFLPVFLFYWTWYWLRIEIGRFLSTVVLLSLSLPPSFSLCFSLSIALFLSQASRYCSLFVVVIFVGVLHSTDVRPLLLPRSPYGFFTHCYDTRYCRCYHVL